MIVLVEQCQMYEDELVLSPTMKSVPKWKIEVFKNLF